MILLRVVEPPKSYMEDDDYTVATLDEGALKNLQSLEFDLSWYWYVKGYYHDGAGALIGFKDGLFAIVDLGHCSCYGPMEKVNYGDPLEKSDLVWHTLLDCIKSHTESSYRHHENLYKAILEYFVGGRVWKKNC